MARSLLKVIFGGIIASLAMLAFLKFVPLLGATRLNSFVLLSTLSPTHSWWAQPLEYFALAIVVFPVLFSYMFYDNLPGRMAWSKGLFWGLILWVLRGLVVAPVMGEGLFSLQAPEAIPGLWETLVAHLIYGLVLGFVVGLVTVPRERHRLHA